MRRLEGVLMAQLIVLFALLIGSLLTTSPVQAGQCKPSADMPTYLDEQGYVLLLRARIEPHGVITERWVDRHNARVIVTHDTGESSCVVLNEQWTGDDVHVEKGTVMRLVF